MIVDRGLERRFGSVIWIGVHGDRSLMEIGVDGVLVMG